MHLEHTVNCTECNGVIGAPLCPACSRAQTGEFLLVFLLGTGIGALLFWLL